MRKRLLAADLQVSGRLGNSRVSTVRNDRVTTAGVRMRTHTTALPVPEETTYLQAMSVFPPPLPGRVPSSFRTTVHGTVFCNRASHLEQLRAGDEVVLIPGPPIEEEPGVWVHLPGGDVVGHLPPEIETWLARWLLAGGRVRARAVKVRGGEVPSWRRLLLEVTCLE